MQHMIGRESAKTLQLVCKRTAGHSTAVSASQPARSGISWAAGERRRAHGSCHEQACTCLHQDGQSSTVSVYIASPAHCKSNKALGFDEESVVIPNSCAFQPMRVSAAVQSQAPQRPPGHTYRGPQHAEQQGRHAQQPRCKCRRHGKNSTTADCGECCSSSSSNSRPTCARRGSQWVARAVTEAQCSLQCTTNTPIKSCQGSRLCVKAYTRQAARKCDAYLVSGRQRVHQIMAHASCRSKQHSVMMHVFVF